MKLQCIIEFVRGIKAPSEYLAAHFRENEPTTERLCTICAHIATPSQQMFGRCDVERSLWATVVVVALVYVADALILKFTTLPPFRWLFKLTSLVGKLLLISSTVYSILRVSIRSNACPKCGSAHIIPLDSPRAKELISKPPTKS